MSGGAYNYIYLQELETLLGQSFYDEYIEEIYQRLHGLGYASDAAADTLTVLTGLRKIRQNRGLGVVLDELQCVWRAVDYWDSGDSSEPRVHEALAKYRQVRSETKQPIAVDLEPEVIAALIRQLRSQPGGVDGEQHLVRSAVETFETALAQHVVSVETPVPKACQ